ncbi:MULTISPECIES: hypothetical protein [unclassified Kitasatospora]|uniref:hypothetical protein n=1 Tax=unclassified Kitasatospora TaxID=2633591 RepID=UPI003409E47A
MPRGSGLRAGGAQHEWPQGGALLGGVDSQGALKAEAAARTNDRQEQRDLRASNTWYQELAEEGGGRRLRQRRERRRLARSTTCRPRVAARCPGQGYQARS